jgi:hypothetical protein
MTSSIRDERLDVVRVTDIADVHAGHATLRGDVGDGALRSITVDIVDHDAGTFCGETQCRRATDARSRTGDHGDLVVERSHRASYHSAGEDRELFPTSDRDRVTGKLRVSSSGRRSLPARSRPMRTVKYAFVHLLRVAHTSTNTPLPTRLIANMHDRRTERLSRSRGRPSSEHRPLAFTRLRLPL